MNLVRCNNGHFYDSESFGACPHCGPGASNSSNLTMPLQTGGSEDVTVAMSTPPAAPTVAAEPVAAPTATAPVSSLQDAVNAAASAAPVAPVMDDNKTVGFFSSVMGKEPVVGWLVCTKGPHFGEDFRLKSGRNFVGRGGDMDVAITKDNTVSRERHAIVVYEPRGNLFLMQPGDSKELCYLNEQVVLSPQTLSRHDKILVGQSELMFIPCCTEDFNWDAAKQEK